MEALGLLAGGVAHDLNNVLSGIVSYPDLLLLDLPQDSAMRKPILTIQDSGQKAAAIVQDLLTLARRGVVTKEVVNLNADIIEDYLHSPEFRKLRVYHPKVRIETDLGGDLLNIEGSPVHLKKTLMNLIANAAEAQPGGGLVTVTSYNQYVDQPVTGYDAIEEGDFVVLSVRDHGLGIGRTDMAHIFEPFYTKKVMGRSGTGLGMAVIWGTVSDHSGYIHVDSEEGRGTRIKIYLPVTDKLRLTAKGTIPINDYRGAGQTILVVDDVAQQREIATQFLTKLGYVAAAVSSGEAAVEYLQNHDVDLVVLDMIMDPGIDGLETYQRVLKLHPGQKAIIASGYAETDRVRQAQELGATIYIKKPYTLEKIGTAVKGELES